MRQNPLKNAMGMVSKDLKPAIIMNLIGGKTHINADIGTDAETQLNVYGHGHVHDFKSHQLQRAHDAFLIA